MYHSPGATFHISLALRLRQRPRGSCAILQGQLSSVVHKHMGSYDWFNRNHLHTLVLIDDPQAASDAYPHFDVLSML